MSDQAQPLVFVTVGTDHHPFQRLIDWVDRWWTDGGVQQARCVVQYGTSRPPAQAEGHALIGHEKLESYMRQAAAIVCHGGPTTIAESRRRGMLPIVVPRAPSLGEHVDDHQERFCARLAADGLIALATDEAELRTLIERALGEPAAFRVTSEGGSVAATVRRFASLVDDLLVSRTARQ